MAEANDYGNSFLINEVQMLILKCKKNLLMFFLNELYMYTGTRIPYCLFWQNDLASRIPLHASLR